MNEVVIHRANPGIDPMLHVWGWEIPVYLFLGGLVAGLMILSGYHVLRHRHDTEGDQGHYVCASLLSLILLSLGMGALFLDLANKEMVWRLYLTFQPSSPMSWGSWILLLVYPALLGCVVMSLRGAFPKLAERIPILGSWSDALSASNGWSHTIGVANIALGAALGIYTGILLSSLGARPLWNSALLGPLFLFSGLSTGAAALHLLSHASLKGAQQDAGFGDQFVSSLVYWIRPASATPGKLEQADNGFLTVELLLLFLWLIGLSVAGASHKEALELLLTGSHAAVFWVGIIGCGILLPLTLQTLQTCGSIRSTPIPAILVLLGGLLLRFVIVDAGQASHWLTTLN